METGKNTNQTKPAAAWLELRNCLPLLYVWGCFDIASAAIEIFWIWTYPEWLQPLLFLAAALLTLAVVWRTQKAAPDRKSESRRKEIGKRAATLAACVLAVWLLSYFRLLDPITAALTRALVLAFFYAVLGVYQDRRLLYLGVWLFALSALIGFAYLGFAPVVLGLFGGLSLIACGRILRQGLTRLKNIRQ